VRNTLTIDDDVETLLRKEMRKTGEPFKEVVNRFLRLGIAAAKQPQHKPFKVKPWNLQPPPGQSFDKVEELIEFLEGPYHR
jgi:hypothetical protein